MSSITDNVPSQKHNAVTTTAASVGSSQDERTKTSTCSDTGTARPSVLTAAQKERIEKNRRKAVLLKQSRLRAHPYRNQGGEAASSVIRVAGSKMIDSGGGFLIDENELTAEENEPINVRIEPAPLLPPYRPKCVECSEEFAMSFLLEHFDWPVCDKCRDNEEKHTLITKTDAKNEYLLRDADFEFRDPPLRFIVRKNPHNPRWGDMKLYLQLQVEDRALEVWGSEENLEEEHRKREEKREASKMKKFDKRIKALRMNVRSSLYKRGTEVHKHQYGVEVYNEDDDTYSKTCSGCGQVQTYEKM